MGITNVIINVMDFEEAVRFLATAHREADPSTTEIFLAPGEDEIRLIEISREIPPSGEVFPVSFNPDPEKGMHYASSVILINPEEWEEVKAGELTLPTGWGNPNTFRPII